MFFFIVIVFVFGFVVVVGIGVIWLVVDDIKISDFDKVDEDYKF